MLRGSEILQSQDPFFDIGWKSWKGTEKDDVSAFCMTSTKRET